MRNLGVGFVLVLALLLTVGVASANPVDLVLWVGPWAPALDALQEVADRFAEQHPDVASVSVQVVVQKELVERLTLAVIGDTPPDVVTLPAPFVQYVINGLLQPIDPYLEQSERLHPTDYPPAIFESFAAFGQQYGIPNIEVGPGLVLIYSKDLFSQAGLADRGPETLDELLDTHRKLTRPDADGTRLQYVGINPLDAMGKTYFPDIWSTVFDIDWYDQVAGELRITDFEPAVAFIKSIYDTHGYAMITGSGIRGWREGLASGRLGMQINGYWTPGELKALEVPYTFGYTWMPTVKGDRATIALPWGMGIPANARNPELSFALMEFFASPEAAQIIFDAVGWLNGNLNAVRQLDISDLPEIAPIVAMFEQADRFASAAPVPIMDTVRQRMPEVLVDVWENTVPGPEALANLQTELQATLNEVLKK